MAKLIRQRDNLVKEGFIEFVEFDKRTNRGKKIHMKPEIGYACIVDRSLNYKWMTTQITEVISDTEFKTKNSHYKIKQ